LLLCLANEKVSPFSGGSQAFDTDDGSSWYNIHHNFWFDSDGFKMDYSGHNSSFHDNLVAAKPYDGQNCINGDEPIPWQNNTCIIMGAMLGHTGDVNGPHQDVIGNFDCHFSANRTAASVSWSLKNNTYMTPNGNASLPCEVTVAVAAASGTGVEEGSIARHLPTDDELVSMARKLLGM
jgi:hypothetical protein